MSRGLTRMSLCPRTKKEARIARLTHWLNRVAMAAPEMPMSKVKIRMGSNTMFSSPPNPRPITDRLAFPCHRSKLLRI